MKEKAINEKVNQGKKGLFVLPGAISISFFLDLDNDKYKSWTKIFYLSLVIAKWCHLILRKVRSLPGSMFRTMDLAWDISIKSEEQELFTRKNVKLTDLLCYSWYEGRVLNCLGAIKGRLNRNSFNHNTSVTSNVQVYQPAFSTNATTSFHRKEFSVFHLQSWPRLSPSPQSVGQVSLMFHPTHDFYSCPYSKALPLPYYWIT